MAMGDSDLISLNVLQGTFNWLRNRPNSILMPRYDLHEQTRPSAKHLVISIHISYSSDSENEYNFFIFFPSIVLRMNQGVSAWEQKLHCSLVVQHQNTKFYVGLDTELYPAVGLLERRHNMTREC